jgi:ABC-2 type transport system ATP-binding protein
MPKDVVPMNQEHTITCQNLSKRFRTYDKQPGLLGSLKSFYSRSYRTVSAVEDFSFSASRSEVIGLLGPNGAGKTTLMKMLTGIIVPSEGEASILGYTPWERKRAFRQRISLVMGQKSQLWWDIPAQDSFELLGRYYELEPKALLNRVGELANLLGVSHLLNVHVRKLSLGERMKMELMASLLHDPEVIFLDEPTIGLDLIAQRTIRDFLLTYQAEHETTIILTSHYMGDVAALADRIVLILEGQKRFDGTIHDFENLFGQEKYVQVEFEEPTGPGDSTFSWEEYDPVWDKENHRVDLRIPASAFQEVTKEILEHHHITNLSTERLPIERVMASIIDNPALLPSPSGIRKE